VLRQPDEVGGTVRRIRREWGLTFAGFALITLALMAPINASSDGSSMLQVGTSLATGHGFAVPCEFGISGRNGQCFSTYYPLQSILAVPLIALGRAVAGITAGPPRYLGGFAAQAVPSLAAAGVASLTAYLALGLGASRRRALLAGITVIFATEVATYYRSFFAETLAALLVCLAVWGFLRADRWRVLAPVAVGGLVLAKPQLVLIGLALGAVFSLVQRRRRPITEAVIATAIAAIAYAGYNALRFGDVTNFGGDARAYHATTLTPTKLLEAAGLLLISPGRGWLIYSPIVILGLYAAWKRRREPLAIAALTVLVATLIPYLGNPGIGHNWGSRYLVPAIPLFVALAWAAPARRWLAPTLAVAGLVIAAPTFFSAYERAYIEQTAHGHLPADTYWSLRRAPLVSIWTSMPHQIESASRTDVKDLAKQPDVPVPRTANSVQGHKVLRVIPQWWWMTPAANVPRPVGLLLTLTMLATGAGILARVSRREVAGVRVARPSGAFPVRNPRDDDPERYTQSSS
jgi:hypothetical protein